VEEDVSIAVPSCAGAMEGSEGGVARRAAGVVTSTLEEERRSDAGVPETALLPADSCGEEKYPGEIESFIREREKWERKNVVRVKKRTSAFRAKGTRKKRAYNCSSSVPGKVQKR
jgi:hypothetical protein